MKWLKRIGIFLAALYVLAGGLLYCNQERLIFHPRPRAADYSYGDYPEEWIDLADGTRLNALHLRRGGRGVVLYLHGNVGDNGRSLYQTNALADLGYDLFLVDYRGYGKSGGTTTGLADFTEDLQVVYDRLKREYAEGDIIVLGYSLGSGPASYLAANNAPRATVLVAPYTSLVDMKDRFFWLFPDFLLRYQLDNRSQLAAAAGPVYILHGEADRLIPVAMGEELAELGEHVELIRLPGVSHWGAILSRRLPELVGRLTGAGR